MKKIFIKVCKLSIIAACICIALLIGFSVLTDQEETIMMPPFLGVLLVAVTFFGVGCLAIASGLEIYQRVRAGKAQALKRLLAELVIISGICFIVARTLQSLATAVGVVVGSWGMNYIYRKEDTSITRFN